MATNNIQIRPKGTGDYADILHPETNTDMVLHKPSGGTLTSILNDQFTKNGQAIPYTGDLNALVKAGLYSIPKNTPNAPYTVNEWTVLVLPSSDGKNIIQLAYVISSQAISEVLKRVGMKNADGVITWSKDTGPGILNGWAIDSIRLNDTLTSSSTTEAATANAIKQVNDKLNGTHVSIGSSSKAMSAGVALGWEAKSTGYFSVSLGYFTGATNYYGTAIGANASSINTDEGVLGVSSSESGTKQWKVPGSFSVTGTKNFEIPHPHPNKKATHIIRHGAVESPTAGDTLYRYTVEAKTDGEVVSLQLPDYFEHLNANVDVWLNGHLHFGRAFGVVEGSLLKVTCEKAGVYKALVIGTRNDDNVKDWHIKGVERQVGESWLGEVYVFETAEIKEVTEFREGIV